MSRIKFKFEKIGKGILNDPKYLVYAIDKEKGRPMIHAPIGMVDRGTKANDWDFSPFEVGTPDAEDVGLNETDHRDPLGCIGYESWNRTREGAVLGYITWKAMRRKQKRERPVEEFTTRLIRLQDQIKSEIRKLAEEETVLFIEEFKCDRTQLFFGGFNGRTDMVKGVSGADISHISELEINDLLKLLDRVKEGVRNKEKEQA